MPIVLTEEKLTDLITSILSSVNVRIADHISDDADDPNTDKTLSIDALKKYIKDCIEDSVPQPMTSEELQAILKG